MPEEQTQSQLHRVRRLNDELRQTLTGGQIMLTAGIKSLTDAEQTAVMRAVVQFNDFTPDNDPYGEHDFGLVTVGATKVMWKIDYYDLNLKYASADPSDPKITNRVLTVMLAEEY